MIEPDGWLHTGDIAVANDDGYFRIVDRKKDIYITGGFNVSPAEVEGHLLRDERIAEVAVIGMPDDASGRGGGRVRRAPAGSRRSHRKTVIAFGREHMANYKVPHRVEIVDALPLERERQGAEDRLARERVALERAA